MKKTKSEKGITLIALIITIVVLLILAVVTIGTVKDSGIIGHAQNAADDYNKAQIEEKSILDGYEDLIKDSIELSFRKFVIKTVNSMEKATGDYYNLVTLKNKIKEKYPTAFGEVTIAGDGIGEYNDEEVFLNILNENIIYKENLSLLLKYENDLIYVDAAGNVKDYNGSVVPMKESEATQLFAYRAPTSSEISDAEDNFIIITAYMGTDTTVNIPAVLYDEDGNLTKIVAGIGEETFKKKDTTNTYTKMSIFSEEEGAITETQYKTLTVEELFSGQYDTTKFDGTSTSLEDKKVILTEMWISGGTPSYAFGFDENLLPYFWVDENGDVMEEYPMNIDITEVYIPIYVEYIGANAFANQTALTSVYMGVVGRPTIASNAFSNCTSLANIYIRLTSNDIKKISGYDTKWGAPESAKLYCVTSETYSSTINNEYDTSNFVEFTE